MPNGIQLRPLTEQDGPGFAGLSYSSADGGMIHYAANYQIDAFKAVQALHGEMEGVVACTRDGWRLVGAGLIRLGACVYEGETYPSAMLGNLIVHPDYRGQGLAAELVAWQVQKARERCGANVVIVTNFQSGNRISSKIYTRWLDQSAGLMTYLPMRTLSSVPTDPPGISTGPLDENEYAEFAAGHNDFYADCNFFQPVSEAELLKLRSRTPFDAPFRHAYAAVDRAGRLLAGLVVMEEYRLKTMEVRSLPESLKLLNSLLHIIPPDGMVREAYLDHLWFRPGQAQALRHLVDTVRWIWNKRATNISLLIDPRGPLREVFPLRPWTVKAMTQLLYSAPQPMSPGKAVCPIY